MPIKKKEKRMEENKTFKEKQIDKNRIMNLKKD